MKTMANDEPKKIEIRYSRQFKRDLKKLAKHYPHIKDDIQPELEKLENGEILGDRLQGTGH
jgi:mRNA-degrading endonuclease YafQ of YafQ-DinJ toxin-antitoxin module